MLQLKRFYMHLIYSEKAEALKSQVICLKSMDKSWPNPSELTPCAILLPSPQTQVSSKNEGALAKFSYIGPVALIFNYFESCLIVLIQLSFLG